MNINVENVAEIMLKAHEALAPLGLGIHSEYAIEVSQRNGRVQVKRINVRLSPKGWDEP